MTNTMEREVPGLAGDRTLLYDPHASCQLSDRADLVATKLSFIAPEALVPILLSRFSLRCVCMDIKCPLPYDVVESIFPGLKQDLRSQCAFSIAGSLSFEDDPAQAFGIGQFKLVLEEVHRWSVIGSIVIHPHFPPRQAASCSTG